MKTIVKVLLTVAVGLESTSARAQWEHQIEVDDMTDVKTCMVTPRAAGMPFPMFHYHPTEGMNIGLVGADFPGKPVTMRVDKNSPVEEEESITGARAQRIVAQIRAGGSTILVRGYEWPDDVAMTKSYELADIVEHLNACRDAVK